MAIKSSEAATKLRTSLQEGEVRFVFIKKDGSRRPSVGTTNLDLVPKEMWPLTADDIDAETRQRNEGVITYYDLEKMAWRCCKVENILEVEGEEIEDE